jgi:hypothetical protein
MPRYFIIGVVVLIAALLAFVAAPAFAQDAGPVIARSSIWYDLWVIVQPIVVLFVSTVGPVLATWIAAQIISLLKVSDQAKQVEIETNLRNALHQSAVNALKFAIAKANIAPAAVGAEVISDAIRYVEEKNPDALKKLDVPTEALREIIMSKIPDLIAKKPF